VKENSSFPCLRLFPFRAKAGIIIKMDKEKSMLEMELVNCNENIRFYEKQIESMKEKIKKLEIKLN